MSSVGPPLTLVAAIADELPLGVWVASVPEGALVYANRAFADILGMQARDDVQAGEYAVPYGIYRRGAGLYPEDELPFVRAMRARGTVVVDDIVIRRADGTAVDVRATARPGFDAAGAMTHITVVFMDITREVLAERARREAEERLRLVINGAPIVLFALDARGVVTLSEGRGLATLGYAPGELVGRSAFDIYSAVPEVRDNLNRVLAGESFVHRTHLGEFTLETTFAPLRDEQGALAGAVGISLDVTAQDRMQQQLLHADRLAAVGTIAAGVAHEINNPLTYILANLDLARRGLTAGRPADVALARLSEARDGVERVAAIAKDLFALSRGPAARLAPVDVRHALDVAVRMSAPQLAVKARLVDEVAALPLVMGDAGRLSQVFLNLLINAAQATPGGDPEAHTIRLTSAVTSAGAVAIEVTDSGVGIAPADLPRIFDPFFTTKAADAGSGLGLSVSKSIVESFGGVLSASSVAGTGSTFRVELRAATGRGAAVVPGAPAVRASARRARVLVVDDNVNLGRVFRAVLEPEHDVTVCTSGRAALEALGAPRAFDLVLCDVMLTDVDVRTLHARLAAAHPGRERAMVFMTGGAYTPDARAFLASVDNRRLVKPFDIHAVVTELLAAQRV